MADWGSLPANVLYSIFRLLSRRDLMSCKLVCSRWADALDYCRLWRNFVVLVDVDLLEPSTTLFLRQYCRYVRSLELGWAVSQARSPRWPLAKYKELTKRTARLLTILHVEGVQLARFRIFNWFDVMPCKKIMYHIRRLLQSQCKLKTLVVDNANLYTFNYIRLLMSCSNCKEELTHLDVRNCHYSAGALDTVHFQEYVEQLDNLITFKLDYQALTCGLIKSMMNRCKSRLSELELLVKGNVTYRNLADGDWEKLIAMYPRLRINVVIRNGHYQLVRQCLNETIPLVGLSISMSEDCAVTAQNRTLKCAECSSEFEDVQESTIRKTLNYLLTYYYNTLEFVDLQLNNLIGETKRCEIVDDLLILMLRKCLKLDRFTFTGHIQNPDNFTEAYRNIKRMYECPVSTNQCRHVRILISTTRNIYMMTFLR